MKGSDCLFCHLDDKVIIDEHNSMIAIEDKFPVTPGHTLIIPKAHRCDYFELSHEEVSDLSTFLQRMRESILRRDASITGFNIGMNCGESAGQTVFHCHVHLIPRRDGDCRNPKGGVRGVIPERQQY